MLAKQSLDLGLDLLGSALHLALDLLGGSLGLALDLLGLALGLASQFSGALVAGLGSLISDVCGSFLDLGSGVLCQTIVNF